MTKEQKNRWLIALRSGMYTQTEGTLHRKVNDGRKVGYCCLGVLAVCEGMTIGETSVYGGIVENGVDEGYNPIKLLLADPTMARILAEFNDGAHQLINDEYVYVKYNFLQIADYIEQNLKTSD